MRERARTVPGVETLESIRSLSGVGLTPAQPAAAIQSLQLSGSLHGTTATRPNPIFQVAGTLSPLGKVKAAGHGSVATVTGPNGSFDLSTPQGRVFVGTDVASVGRRSFAGEYTIQGGTGEYAGARGSGVFTASYVGSRILVTFG
jgi:hypothetical protein